MKKFLLISVLCMMAVVVMAQNSKLAKPYNESIDGMVQIDKALAKAKKEGKLVACQVGGNWCKWCLRFNDFITKDADIKRVIDDNYVYIHVNYSNKNKNEKAMARLGNQQLGYPYLVILNEKGKIVCVQETGVLEKGDSYSKKKVLDFFRNTAR